MRRCRNSSNTVAENKTQSAPVVNKVVDDDGEVEKVFFFFSFSFSFFSGFFCFIKDVGEDEDMRTIGLMVTVGESPKSCAISNISFNKEGERCFAIIVEYREAKAFTASGLPTSSSYLLLSSCAPKNVYKKDDALSKCKLVKF